MLWKREQKRKKKWVEYVTSKTLFSFSGYDIYIHFADRWQTKKKLLLIIKITKIIEWMWK